MLLFSFMNLSAAAQTQPKPAADLLSLEHVFDYDLKQPLDIYDKIIAEFSDGTLHDITYTRPKGGPVAGYLVVPKGKGPFAAASKPRWTWRELFLLEHWPLGYARIAITLDTVHPARGAAIVEVARDESAAPRSRPHARSGVARAEAQHPFAAHCYAS